MDDIEAKRGKWKLRAHHWAAIYSSHVTIKDEILLKAHMHAKSNRPKVFFSVFERPKREKNESVEEYSSEG